MFCLNFHAIHVKDFNVAYRALRDVFCFDVLSGNALKILTLTKKARGQRVTCYDAGIPCGLRGSRRNIN